MLDTYICAFFGHRDFKEHFECEKRIINILKEMLSKYEYVEFLVGREGEFDTFAASMVQKVKKEYFNNNCSLVWVMPYKKSEYTRNKEEYDRYYDSIEVCEKAERAHFKSAIKIRNYDMAERANAVICYIERESGNAFQAVKFAKEKCAEIINLCESNQICL